MSTFAAGDKVTVRTGKKVWTVVWDLGPSVVIRARLSRGYSHETTRVLAKSYLNPVKEA